MFGKMIRAGAVLAVVGWMLAGAGAATASTFCVPVFFAACPDNGENQVAFGATPAKQLDVAMSFTPGNSDGIPDTVRIAPGTFADNDSGSDTGFQAHGTDDLTVIGSGRDETFLTSGGSDNSYVVDFAYDSTRKVTVRDLAIVIPGSFPDSGGFGAGVQATGDDFLRVDLINRNPGAGGFANLIGGGSLTDIRVFTDNASHLSTAIGNFNCAAGDLTVRNLRLSGAYQGVTNGCAQVPVTVSEAHIRDANKGIVLGSGVDATIENTLIEGGDSQPLDIYNGSGDEAAISLNQVTLVATGDPAVPGLRAKVAESAAATGSIQLSVENSVFAGFQNSWQLEAPDSSPLGDVLFTGRYSRFGTVGTELGGVGADTTEAVTFGAPGFAGVTDFRPAENSPLVDAGDPGATLPDLDLDGRHRPLDGNGDGAAVRDIGAFERPEPTPPKPPVAGLTVTKVKFRYRVRKGGKLTFGLNRKAKIRVLFTPVPRKSKSGKKRRPVKFTRTAKAGRVTVRLKRRLLRPGRYRLTVSARVPDGSPGAVARRMVLVRPK